MERAAMTAHPFDASDPSSADGPADEQQGDEDYLAPFVGERTYLPPRPRVRREATLGTFNDEQWPGGDAVPATPSPCPRPATECWWHMAVHFLPLEERTREGCLFCADGPADATRAEVTSGQGYLLRDRPPPRTADDIAALIIDRDDARAALYRAHDDMWKMREDCDALRVEAGLTFKQLCDAATLAGFLEGERDEARAENQRLVWADQLVMRLGGIIGELLIIADPTDTPRDDSGIWDVWEVFEPIAKEIKKYREEAGGDT